MAHGIRGQTALVGTATGHLALQPDIDIGAGQKKKADILGVQHG